MRRRNRDNGFEATSGGCTRPRRGVGRLVLGMGMALLAGCAGADASADASDGSPGSAVAAPAGDQTAEAYQFRLDSERSDPGEFRTEQQPDDAVRITTGPAGIAWRAADRIGSGDFEVQATFVQYGAPLGYREAYGLFVGGRDLDSDDQEYTYLLIRGTGDFLIKRRIGETTETLVDWTPHPAVVAVTEEGAEPENHLAITSLDGETVFVVNGVAVHGMESSVARPYGIAGIRANHRLDVRITDWSLESLREPVS